MTISIQVCGNLKALSSVGAEEKNYSCRQGSSVRDILEGLNILDSDVREVKRNGQRARLDTRLRERDVVEIS